MNGVKILVFGTINGVTTVSLSNGGITTQRKGLFAIVNETTVLTAVSNVFDRLEVTTTKTQRHPVAQ